MKRFKLLGGALLLVVSGLAAATAPVLDVTGSAGLFLYQGYLFNVNNNGLFDASFSVPSTPAVSIELLGIFDKVGSSWAKVGDTVGAGSFSFTGNSSAQYIAIAEGLNLGSQPLPYHITVTGTPPIPEPESWAMMLLGIGFVLYQVRPRNAGGSVNLPG